MSTLKSRLQKLIKYRLLRELLILAAFCFFTAVMTWPYVLNLRSVVVDTGDPYLISWILWWDYHATFTDPLNLFHANVFYPYRYTLAFSEHSYGIALLFFPLYAIGLRPLTVHAIAMFFGFALSGYAAFRLTRTLTNSNGAAWVAGIIFAFIPYRFHLMSQVAYLFSPWIPLLFEALVLFVRKRSRGHAVWLGFAFFFSGLTAVSWFTFSLVPFMLSAAILLTRYDAWRDRAFWQRAAVALGLASIALLPFMFPYYIASKMYGFQRSIQEIAVNSAWPVHWLSVENRNKFWNGLGSGIPESHRFKLFPGLLPLLLSLAAVIFVEPLKRAAASRSSRALAAKKWLPVMDVAIALAFVAAVLSIGFAQTEYWKGVFKYLTSERALSVLTLAIIARLSIAYPELLRRGENTNLIETIRSERRSVAFWLSGTWVVIGFCYSLGWNFFFYRILYDLLPMFRSMRVASRGAMIAYLGLAVLAGLGVERLIKLVRTHRPRFPAGALYAAVCGMLLFELNGAPLKYIRGDVYPDAVTLRLKETPMRGGIVMLPAGADFNHRHMLRAADHAKPLIVGTSGFNPPYEDEIERLTLNGPIPITFLDLLEKIPASYVVIQNHVLNEERRVHYEAFLLRAVASGRMRLINRFDGRDDLYAVVKTEPATSSEMRLPFPNMLKEWGAMIKEDPVHMIGHFEPWTESVYMLYVTALGRMPRYEEFLADLRILARGVIIGVDEPELVIEQNLRQLADELTRRAEFTAIHGTATDAQYFENLSANAGLELPMKERSELIGALASGNQKRAGVLLQIARDERVRQREHNRALVLMHFFAYLRRNPDDPPDGNLNGFNHWVKEMEKFNGRARLSDAFKESIERNEMLSRTRKQS